MTRSRAARRPRPRCVPSGPLAEPPFPTYRCRCGALLTLVDNGRGDWSHVDPEGRASIDNTPAELVADPKRWWDDLAAKDPGTYSNLLARTQLGQWSWHHVHLPAETVERVPCEVPECCDSPMWASPRGWACRKTGDLFSYEAAVTE